MAIRMIALPPENKSLSFKEEFGMRKRADKIVLFLVCVTILLIGSINVHAQENEENDFLCSQVTVEGIKNENLSLDGKNLHLNSEKSFLNIDSFQVTGDNASFSGSIEDRDAFHIIGKVYQAADHDGYYIVKGTDASQNYDVLQIMFEKLGGETTLFTGNISQKDNHNYVLRIYLMKKNTRQIYLYEYFCDLDGLSGENVIDPAAIMWFKDIVEPEVVTDLPSCLSFGDTKEEVVIDYMAEKFWMGDCWVKVGYKVYVVTVVDGGYRDGGEVDTKLKFERIAESSGAAYRDPGLAGYRIQNAACEFEVKDGYFMKSLLWSGKANSTISNDVSIYFNIGFGMKGASVNLSAGLQKVSGTYGNYIPLPEPGNLYPKTVSSEKFPSNLSTETHYYGAKVQTVCLAECPNYIDEITVKWTFDVYEKNTWGFFVEQKNGVSGSYTYAFME